VGLVQGEGSPKSEASFAPGFKPPGASLATTDGTWLKLLPGGTPPTGRIDHTAIYDPVGNRMVVFGGLGGSGMLNDVWP
jgi:hypothetical protein